MAAMLNICVTDFDTSFFVWVGPSLSSVRFKEVLRISNGSILFEGAGVSAHEYVAAVFCNRGVYFLLHANYILP